MARGVNKVILLGNVGKDPEIRYFPSGDAQAKFSLATSESWNDKESGEKREKVQWHNIVANKKLAEIIGEYVKKGDKLYVEGKVEYRSWDDKDGNKKYMTEIVIHDMQMLTPKAEGAPASRAAPAADAGRVNANQGVAAAAPAPQAADGEFVDDDIPF